MDMYVIEIVIAVVGTTLAGLLSVIAWMLKRTMDNRDARLGDVESNQSRAVRRSEHAELEGLVNRLATNVAAMQSQLKAVADMQQQQHSIMNEHRNELREISKSVYKLAGAIAMAHNIQAEQNGET